MRILAVETLESRCYYSFGDVDTSWGTSGRIVTSVGSTSAAVASLAIAGGKIYAAGDAAIVRYTSNGAIDSSFGAAGKVPLGGNRLIQVLIGADNSVYALTVGSAGTQVIKLSQAGVRDNGFGSSGTALVTPETEAAFAPKAITYAGGKLIVAGQRLTSDNNSATQLYRLTGNGSLDSNFGSHGSVQFQLGLTHASTPKSVDQIARVSVLSNGQIVLAGSSMAWNPDVRDAIGNPIYGNAYLVVAKFSSSGKFDQAFGVGGIARAGIPSGQTISFTADAELADQFTYSTRTVAIIRSDGSAVVVGRGVRLTAASFDANGVIGYTSSADAGFQLDLPSDMAVLNDGRMVVSGLASRFYRGHGPVLVQLSSAGVFSPYVLTDDLQVGTTELIDDNPSDPDDQYFRPHPIATSPDGELLVGGQPVTGSGFELEKFKVGNAADPRPDTFSSGSINDLVQDANGSVDLAYFDQSSSTLKYAHRAVNGHWSSAVTVDATQFSGDYLSLALDSHNAPSIAYHDGLNGDLKFAHSSDGGATWNTQTVDSSGSTGLYPSLVVDAVNGTDQAMITYYRKSSGDLRFATLDHGAWSISTVETTGNVGRSSRLYKTATAITPEPVVAYVDSTNNRVRFATRQADGSWSRETVATLGGAADYLNIDYGAESPAISFYDAFDANLRVAYRSGGSWVSPIVASNGAVGLYTAVTSFARFDSTVHEQVYAYDKTTNSVSLYAYAETGEPLKIDSLLNGGKYLSVARSTDPRIVIADAAFIDSRLNALRVGTLFNPIDDHIDQSE